ncbi:MAG: hypothetical protein ACREMK_09965 [Gemmatimonadota bacterium]
MPERIPARPAHLDPLAEEILESLRGSSEAGDIVLGGYFALKHYLDYRLTHDIDAWWRTSRRASTMDRIREVMGKVAAKRGMMLREREWGDTASFELIEEGRKVFSFQIATRSVELDPPTTSAWDPILIESLADNVGAKMNAVVERGAARDFLDVKELVTRGLVTVEECWRWWSGKNAATEVLLAKANALRHLEALEQRRPLDEITDPEERDHARAARRWVRKSLLEIEGTDAR